MKTNWVDFKAVKEAVHLEQVLRHYGVHERLRGQGDERHGRCPIHKGEGEDAFHVNFKKNAFQCFSCKARGNVLDFVAAMESCSVRDAAVKLQEWFGNENAAGDRGTSPPQKTPATDPPTGDGGEQNQPLKFQLKGIDSAHPYLAERGLTKETAEEFGIGFFTGKGQMSGRIVIPIHNERGELVAYGGRSIDGAEPRYKLPGGFYKSQVLFNLHRSLLREEARVSTVVVVEGFFGCIKVHMAGYPSVALMGSSMSAEQEQLLCSNFTGVVLLLDRDDAGRTATDDYLLRLGRRLWVKAISLPDGKQPDQFGASELDQILRMV